MKAISIAAAGFSLAVAGSAIAADRASDAAYLKANRCQALAKTLGPMDTSAIDAFVKTEGRTRSLAVMDMAEQERARAQREARSDERKARLQAELSGPCLAYLQPTGASGQQ